MSATVDRLRGRVRWSLAARCPRAAAHGLLGHEPAEPTDYQQRVWKRGKMLGEYMAERFEDRYGRDNVIREKSVAWPRGLPLGELHTDVVVVSERLAVEVKSSHSPDSLISSALKQLAGEIHYDDDVDHGALALIDPIDLGEQILPFVLSPEAAAEVEEIAEMVASAGRTGILPDCVCATPGACRGSWCPYTDVAWEGWEPPAAETLDGAAAELATGAWQALRLKRAYKQASEAADKTFKEITAQLLDLGVTPGREYLSGPLRLLASPVKGRKTFSLSRAEKLNLWTDADDSRFHDLITVGEGHVRWTIQKEGEAPLVIDFGDEVPF